jgi:glycosyltransferase involved in cell wall biosynthesis
MDIIPNAVATAHFTQSYPESELAALESQLNKQLGDVFIITTSRLVLKNAADDVIKALPLLPANVKFLILGTGPDEAMLKSLAKELKVENRAIFYGHVDHKDMPKFLKVSDIFIRPSLSEGLGNSFLEAMAAEIPVIATPVGGIPDFLFDPEKNPDQGPTGLFCNVRDPESIAVKIKTYIEDNALRARIIKNAKAMVLSRYDWEIIARDMAGVFAKL